ncbi:beta-lactamase family protein [Dendryphion nanum]|uniref:Beta-lactamase family protein n=1 Tax=Dendryphion nanum TaxID=256645 RepID=A0A9P9DQI3_9PLEO|nr:beta-lactamase family protein [Dendryphion nanum]
MSPTFSPSAASNIRFLVDTATSGTPPTLPSTLLHLISHDNNILFSHGSTSFPDLPTPTSTSLFTLHSLTKPLGTILFLRLTELYPSLTLDSPTLIPTHLPELATKKVLTGYTVAPSGTKTWHLEDQHGTITPRMLLNHTYGGGHTYFNRLLFEYVNDKLGVWASANEIADIYQALLASPLLWQPGTHTNYGQGFDWLAVLIERFTKRSLPDLLEEYIFAPLGITDIGYEAAYGGTLTATQEQRGKFWQRSWKQEDGSFVVVDPSVPEIVQKNDAFPIGSQHIHPFGTGLIGSAQSVARIMSILLPQNAGVDPVTKTRILSEENVRAMISPQLPSHIRNQSRKIESADAVPNMIIPIDLSVPHLDPEGSFGLGCGVQGAERVLENGQRGRSKGSVYWYGAANSEVWVDGEKGVVGVVNAGFFPWNEGRWIEWVGGVEGEVYGGLKEEGEI